MFQVEKSLFLENHNFIKCFYEKHLKGPFFCENNILFNVGGKGIGLFLAKMLDFIDHFMFNLIWLGWWNAKIVSELAKGL